MATFCDGIVQNIERTECIGNSLVKINSNFSGLETAGCDLENELAAVEASVISLSSITNQITPTVLFVPVNYNTFSNANPMLSSWSSKGNVTNTSAWWSGIQTLTIPNCPTNAVAVLLQVKANTNSYANNGQSVFFYKSEEQTSVNLPNTNTTPGNITIAQANNINTAFSRISLDPNPPEAEDTSTFPIYINVTTKQIKYFWVDYKGTVPTANPDYYVGIRLLGYYVKFA
jgi:hypothetical protein